MRPPSHTTASATSRVAGVASAPPHDRRSDRPGQGALSGGGEDGTVRLRQLHQRQDVMGPEGRARV